MNPIEIESLVSLSMRSGAGAWIVLVAFLIWVAKAFVIPRPSCCIVNSVGVGEV